MKLAPLLRELRSDAYFAPLLVHTGQHYDDRMSGQFFRDLGLKEPDYQLQVGSGSHAWQTAEIMKKFEPVLTKERPDGVVVVGDVNSTLACVIVAKKMGISVVHVEAGLRSFDRSMPEEINRILTDSVSDLLLATEPSAVQHLRSEGIPEQNIKLVGNLMIDSLHYHLPQAQKLDIVQQLGLRSKGFGLVTLHRPANVDDPQQLNEILSALEEISHDLPLVFPVHPRTRAHLNPTLCGPQVKLIDALGYLEFLALMANAKEVYTDSGGIQEETTALRIPCFTLRPNTERPITVTEGSNVIAGTERASILQARRNAYQCPKHISIPPLWDGKAAMRCRMALHQFFHQNYSVTAA